MRQVILTSEQREQLTALRNTSPVPYLRERAAAVLKVADGISARQVALYGLLRRRKPDDVYEWLDRFAQSGIEGLKILPGSGRKPAFFPPQRRRSQAAAPGYRPA